MAEVHIAEYQADPVLVQSVLSKECALVISNDGDIAVLGGDGCIKVMNYTKDKKIDQYEIRKRKRGNDDNITLAQYLLLHLKQRMENFDHQVVKALHHAVIHEPANRMPEKVNGDEGGGDAANRDEADRGEGAGDKADRDEAPNGDEANRGDVKGDAADKGDGDQTGESTAGGDEADGDEARGRGLESSRVHEQLCAEETAAILHTVQSQGYSHGGGGGNV